MAGRRTGFQPLLLPTSRYAKYPGSRPQTYLSSHRYSVRAKQFPSAPLAPVLRGEGRGGEGKHGSQRIRLILVGMPHILETTSCANLCIPVPYNFSGTDYGSNRVRTISAPHGKRVRAIALATTSQSTTMQFRIPTSTSAWEIRGRLLLRRSKTGC